MSELTRSERKPWWDWADLISKALVPIVITFVGLYVGGRQYNGQQDAEEIRAEQSTLQAYFDGMQTLLLEQHLRHKPDKKVDVRNLARARTITALDALSPNRKRRLLRFLYETQLIEARTQGQPVPPDDWKDEQLPIISLRYADLTGTDLSNRRLLMGTDLDGALMIGTNLAETNLSGASLTGADLRDANLYQADLTKANLEKVEGISAETLQRQAGTLKGATMPNGQKYEDWLKDKEDSKEKE